MSEHVDVDSDHELTIEHRSKAVTALICSVAYAIQALLLSKYGEAP
jgi:hypothetical protein